MIIFSENIEDHKIHLERIFLKLKSAGICLNAKKSQIGQDKVKILGHILSYGKVKPDPEKLMLYEAKNPETVKDLRSFLSTANIFRDFLPELAHTIKPLNDLLKGQTKRSTARIDWNDISETSFKEIKKLMLKDIERNQPDLEKDFIVITDASERAIGGILGQEDKNGQIKTIYAYSKTLDGARKNYSVTEKELLAIIICVEKFKHYLLGKPFKLKTDHKALEFLWSCKNPPNRLVRWALRLQEFNFTIEHIEGEKNPADFLSRPIQEKLSSINNIRSIPELSQEEKERMA